jgi:tetratricopeptide (TPR) repeat protein
MSATRLSVLGLITLAAFTQPAEAKLRKWNQKMQELGKTFSEMMPLVTRSKPLSPAETKSLAKATEKLATLAHTVNMGPDAKGGAPLPPEADPTLPFVSSLFDRQVKSANRAMQAGQVDYARASLRRVAGYCIACHSRHDKGPDFPTFELKPELQTLSALEKAELLAALRQFDGALDEFEKAVADKQLAKSAPFDWERGLRSGLNLAVRVKHDPKRASTLVEQGLGTPTAPGFLKQDLQAWKESLELWRGETANDKASEEELYGKALNLTAAAKLKQQFPLDHDGDVLYLRASALLHEQLVRFPGGKRASEAMLLAGDAYRLLGETLLSPLPEMYYEACVRQSPHTTVGERCFARFEESIYFGYSGSGGTFIPGDVQELLTELKELSGPKR